MLGSLTPGGSYVDARMVGSTVRLVVRSQPDLKLPVVPNRYYSEQQLLKRNRAAVRAAPLSAWLPRYRITGAGGAASTGAVPCSQVSHPRDYTGASMLTVYSIDLARGFGAVPPISLAADGDVVYGTPTSLYVASNPRWWAVPMMATSMSAIPVLPRRNATGSAGAASAGSGTAGSAGTVSGGSGTMAPGSPPPSTSVTVTPKPVPPVPKPLPVPEPLPVPQQPPQQTEIHRFDITGDGAPRYVASGTVRGRLLNQYSLSDYAGHLRVATTSEATSMGPPDGSAGASSSVYVLDASSMAKVGEVDGLGKGQRIYSVRFIGPVGYVVTFRQVDPLYTLDLRDPAAPRVAGELELSGYSSYLHPGAAGRLIGIGQDADANGRVAGLQVSLFDVGNPAAPHRLAHLVRAATSSVAESDAHAFLYWPDSGLAVLPTNSWNGGELVASALVLKITDTGIAVTGTITQPSAAPGYYQPGIERTLVIGGSIWTVSEGGLLVSDAAGLARQAWIPYA